MLTKSRDKQMRNTFSWAGPLFFILHFSFFISLSSCLDEPATDEGNVEEREITFSMRVPGSSGATRALSTADEMEIADIFVLVFDRPDDTFLYMASGKMQPGSGVTRSFTVTLRTGTFDLIVLANTGRWITENYPGGIPRGEPREEVEKKLLASLANGSKWKTITGDFTPLPFWGELMNATIDEQTDFSSSALSLTRAVASIEVEVAAAAQDDFTLESIYLYNPTTRGRLIPDRTLYAAGKPSVAGTASTVPLLYSGNDITTTGVASRGAIYTFEADKGSTQEFRENTCLVIGGTYKGAGPYYYRVDFREETSDGSLNYLPILGNYRYHVTIRSVEYAGWSTPEEAFNALPVSIRAEVTSWEEGYDREVDIDQNNFYLSRSAFTFRAVNDEQGNIPFTESITITSSQDWTYEVSTSPHIIEGDVSDWFTHTRQGSSKNDVIHFTLQENQENKRYVYLHFKVGNLTHIVTICQHKHNYPNAYFLKPGGSLQIPVRKAYVVWDNEIMGDQRQSLSGIVTTGVIWQDVEDLVTVSLSAEGDQGDKSNLLVTAPGSDVGNAVVGVYIDGTLRYSWHIWVTSYDPDKNQGGTTYLYNNSYRDYLFMDRNLGATTSTPGEVSTLGNYYQWGRKDPFPGPSAIASGTTTQKTIYGTQITLTKTPKTTGSGDNNIHQTLLLPSTYYYNGSLPYSWYTTQTAQGTHNPYLWIDENGDKGLFDPCPDGWRVPFLSGPDKAHYFPWTGLNTTNFPFNATTRGRTYLDGSFYPAAGNRYYSGAIANVGTHGVYHTANAVILGYQSYHMTFSSTNTIQQSNNQHYATGGSIRCVRDE